MKKYLLIIILLPITTYAGWFPTAYPGYGACWPTKEAACNGLNTIEETSGYAWSGTNCVYTPNGNGVGLSTCSESCPEGEIRNPETGFCEIDCSENQGEFATASNTVEPPGLNETFYCYQQCEVAVTYYFQSTQDQTWWTEYTYSGESCQPGSVEEEWETEVAGTTGGTGQTDTDGDGTPDDNDEDIDGDGTNNSEDDDDDGDGVLDEDDSTPGGYQDESFASTGTSCLQQPSCSGDAIQCAQLVEIWRLRCNATEDQEPQSELLEEIPDTQSDNLIANIEGEADSVLQNYDDEMTSFVEQEHDMDLDETIADLIKDYYNIGSCSDLNYDFSNDFEFNMTCGESSPVRVVMSIIFAILTIYGVYQLLVRPVD